MRLNVAYLIGRFPVLYERALLREITIAETEGVDGRVISYHASGEAVPDEFAGLAGKVDYLDVARDMGKIVSGIAGLGVGIGYTFLSPGMVCACASQTGVGGANIFARRARLGRLLGDLRPDLVHAQFGHLGLCFRSVIEEAKLPFVVSFRGQDVAIVGQARSDARGELFSRARRIFTRSSDMSEDLVKMGCPPDRLAVLPSGIDVDGIPFGERSAPESEDDTVILMAGRLVEKKGFADGLRALARSRPGPAGPRLRIAGEGPDRTMLEDLAAELDIAGRTEFLGGLSHEELLRQMTKAHLFMLPCRTAKDGEKEGIPNVIKEAQASGLPVLSTRHAGIPECVEGGVSGLLCDEEDVEGLAANLDRLLSQSGQWPAMGRRGRELVMERFDIRTLVPQLISHYHAVIGEAS